ncbi:MAG: phosphotriesterase-related protein [Gordonia sp. (in: high G+C Gram-positive bacteria)]|uniref:phosphotriesterase family protein n=1 Tax=Gordonia sp. (in: high G+C Gram-positive bacteria) TaxID=84139 RepID=UPI003BB6AC4F
MQTINTVTGPIPVADLGRVLPHEHVFILNEDYRLNFLPEWDEDAHVAHAVDLLRRVKASGIDTLLDVSVAGMGRNVERVRRVAEHTDLNVLVTTGYFTYHDLPLQLHYTGPGLGFDVPDPMTATFVRDLTEGIGHTGIKAAALMCAIEAEGLSTGVERIMRAVGQAAVLTGAPVIVHTNPHTESGLVAQRVLSEEGVDLTRVMLAHSGDTGNLDYLRHLADAGSILGMDRFGVDVLLPHEVRIATVHALLEAGYADRMVLSQSAYAFSDWFDDAKKQEVAPDWTYFNLVDRVIPALTALGVSAADLTTMMVDVPRRWLTGETTDSGTADSGPGLAPLFSVKSGSSPEKQA